MLPFGSEQWENLAAGYNTHIPSGHAERDGGSLSRKVNKLYKAPKPSGNGTCPPHIERSKRLKLMMFMMEERQAAGDAECQRQKEERERELAERDEKRAAEREMREQQSQQLMLMLMTKLMVDRNNN
ncbi:unnamed protein product [Phytophthora fragariaefolia]|uniref:Unnamed protein product n=1 Tax=Phytophthora fragariaefolia TaxID=1490495 RepID=A0A9W6XRX0_9STRA|nr:unnamed protein product [Phytophthora fragariaefolia]